MQNEEKQNFDAAPKTVWLDKYQIPVYTDLKRADEILYATDTQLLKRPKTNYFALADLGAPAQDIAKKSLSGIPFSALSTAAPFGGAGILLAKTPFMRGIYKAGIDMTRQAAAGTLKDAGTAATAFGQDIDTRLKRDAQIDRDLAQMPASIRWQEKFMQNYKAAFSMLGPVDINRVNERLEAWENEQNKIDEFNGKVKTVVDLFTKRAGLDKTEKDGFWYDLGSGAGSFLFSVGALAVTRNPALVAPIFGIIEGQGSYEQAVEAGVEPAKAYGLGKANSAWITATELVGEGLLNKLLFTKGVMGRAAQRILKRAKGKAPTAQITLAGALGAAQGTAIEGTQEAVQSVGSNVILNLGGAQEKDVQEIALEALYEGLIGGLMGAFGGAAGGSANYARYAQNVKERFTQIGLPEETAQRLAHEIALEAVSSELTDDTVAAVSGEINSPLTAQDRDPQAFKAALTDAQKREIDKNAWAVGERVEQQALAAGVTSEEAAASGRVAQALANGIYRLAKLTPTEQEHFKISILNGSNQMEGTPAFAQGENKNAPAAVDLTDDFADINKKSNTDRAAEVEVDRKLREANLPPDFDFTLSQERYEAAPRVNPEDITEVHNQVTGEVIPLEMNPNIKPFEQQELKNDFLPPVKNAAQAKRQVLDTIFGKKQQIIIRKDGKNFTVSRSSAKKMFNTAMKEAMDISEREHLTPEQRRKLYHEASELVGQALQIFKTAQKILSHKDVKNVPGRTIHRYGSIFNYSEKTYYAMFVSKQDGILADLHLYDLQTEENKDTAGISGVTNNPSQQRYINSIDDLVRFVKRKIAKYNKNTKKGTGLELLQENFKGETYNQDTITVKHSAAMYRNPEFKAWFGQSKLVDDAGNPLVVYHGTNQTFNEFKINPLSKWLGKLGEGIYFTDNPQTAQGYGEDIATDNKPAQVYPVYLRLENPLVLKDFLSPMPKDMSGYDGVICGPEGNREIVVFSPEQIKSVNNSGTWNTQTTNIYEQGENPQNRPAIFGELPEISKHSKNKKADVEVLPQFKEALNNEISPIKLTETFSDEVLFGGEKAFRKHLFERLEKIEGRHYVSFGSSKALVSNLDANKMFNTSNSFLSNDFRKMNKVFAFQLQHLLPNAILAKRYADLNGGKEFFINRYFVPVEYQGSIYIVKLTLKEFAAIRKGVFSGAVYEANGRKDYGQYNLEIVKKITLGNAELPLKEVVRPSQGSKDSIDNNAQKIKGITWAQALAGVTDNSGAYVPIEEKGNFKGETYKQNIRGNVSIDEAAHEAIIRIFKDADPSTIVHELAHVYLSMIQRAATVSTDAEFTAFMDDLNAWLGEPQGENGAYSREQQEMFASGFEAYLAEGKAPNKELESVFEKFAKWLAEVYESVKDYLQITPQVRSIFDRLLAPAEPVLRSKVGDKLEAAKQLVEQMKKGRGLEIEGLGLADIKDLLKTLSVRKPAAPKTDLLKDLRKHGVNYACVGQIDKEAYKNARVYDKKDGVDDRPDVWLQKLGYMDFAERTPETLAEAYDKIQRALDGEKVYRLEDQTAAESRAAYEERLQTILQIFPDVKTAQEALKSIARLEEMGYRAVEKRDIASFERLLAELENLVTTKQDTKEGENAFKAADRLRREVINEIQKRSLAEKQIMLDWLNKAKTTEEIREATGNVLEFLEKQYAKTDEAKAEAEMLAIPKTNYGALKIKILKSINDINEQAAQEVKTAQARLAELARAETRGLTLNSEELNERARLRGVLEKQLNEPYRRAILAALAGIRHLPAADKGKFLRTFMGARAANFLPQEIDDILRRAKEIEETNYKKHLDKRIHAVLAQNLFDKTGSLKRALLDAQTINAIGQLKDVLKKSPEEAAQELQERINISMANPGGVSTTDKIVNELLSIVANGTKESSMELYKQTFDDITALRKAGRSAMNLQKMVRDFRTEADKQEVLTALKKNKEHGLLKRLFLGHIGNWESFLDLSTSKEIKEKYSMLLEESDCIAYTWTRRKSIGEAAKRVYRLNSHAELGNKINELLKETDTFMNYALVDNNPDPAAIRKVGEVFPEKLNKMQLINAYIYCKNDVLRDRLIKQYGKEQLQDMLFNRLSAQDRAFGDLLQKEAEDSYQMINRVFVRERGYDLPKTQAYFPSRVTRVESDIDLLKAAAEMSKNPSFTKFRSGSAAIQMELGNPLDILFSHIGKAAEYAYKSEKINRIRRVFMSSQLKPWFEKVLTKDGYNVFVNMIEDISTDKTKAQHDIDKLGNWLTNNYVRGAIALKPTIAIKQLISAMNYAENMPSNQWAAGFVKAVAHPKETVQFMLDADPYLRARYESGSMNEAMEKMMAAAEAFGKAQKVMSLTNLLSISTRLGDIGAIVFGGKPYVDYLMSQKGMSKEEAIKECRKSTLRSQQFNGKSSLSRHQINGKNGGYIVRALLAFRNTPAQYARKIAEAIAEFQRGEITAAQLGKTVAIYALFNNWVYSLVTSLSVLAKLLGEDEEADEMLFNDFILSPFTQMAAALPILSEASNFAAAAVSSKVFDHKVNLNNVGRMPVLSDLVNLGAKAIKENKSAEDVLNMFFTSVQYGLGLPAHYLGALPGAAKDMAGENPMRGFLKALGYTKYRAGKITGEEE